MKYISAWLLLSLLVACSPYQQTYVNSVESKAQIETDRFITRDGIALPQRVWLPKKKPQAVIIALHGFNDYSNAFEGTGTFFAEHGMAVYAYDQRGFGQSPERGMWGNEQNFVGDLKDYVTLVSKRHPGRPVYILGESMGGAVVIAALSDPSFPEVSGVILAAPAVWGKETMHPIYRATLWLAANTFPYRTFTGSDLKIQASNNIEMLRRLSRDPLIIKATRVDAVYGMVHLMDSAYEKVPQMKVPVLLLYGEQDQVIPEPPMASALKRFSQSIVYAYYPDGYHMLLRDLQGEDVMTDILSWIKSPTKKLPSGFGDVYRPSEN